MSYCTYSDVQSEFKSASFTSSTPVKDTEVTEFIVQTDALINAMISNRYVVPVVTGTQSLSLLKMISIQIVTERIKSIVAVKTGDEETSQDPNKQFLISPMEMLKKISEGDIDLIGAEESGSNGVKSYNSDYSIKHVFKKGCDQW